MDEFKRSDLIINYLHFEFMLNRLSYFSKLGLQGQKYKTVGVTVYLIYTMKEAKGRNMKTSSFSQFKKQTKKDIRKNVITC